MSFNELVRLLEDNGFVLIKEKGSVRHYSKEGWVRPIRVDAGREQHLGSFQITRREAFASISAGVLAAGRV